MADGSSNGSIWLRRLHAVATAILVALWILASFTGWIHSVAFISHISMATFIYTTATAWQASRVEVKQDQRDNGS